MPSGSAHSQFPVTAVLAGSSAHPEGVSSKSWLTSVATGSTRTCATRRRSEDAPAPRTTSVTSWLPGAVYTWTGDAAAELGDPSPNVHVRLRRSPDERSENDTASGGAPSTKSVSKSAVGGTRGRRVSIEPSPSVSVAKKSSQSVRKLSRKARSAGGASVPSGTTSTNAIRKWCRDDAASGTRGPCCAMTSSIVTSTRVPDVVNPTNGIVASPSPGCGDAFAMKNIGETSSGGRRPRRYSSSSLMPSIARTDVNVPSPLSRHPHPSITEPPVSRKKLQCALSRPSRSTPGSTWSTFTQAADAWRTSEASSSTPVKSFVKRGTGAVGVDP